MKAIEIGPIVNSIHLVPADIESFARWKLSLGHKVVYKRGIYWEKVYHGFYQPLHLLQKLEPAQIKRPELLGWGARGALADKDAAMANSHLNIYTLENFKSFDISIYSQKRRETIRKCFKRLDIKEIRDEKILYDQGYEVVKSSLERTKHKNLISKANYLVKCAAYVNNGDNSHLVVGAFLEDRLVAYCELCAVEETVYLMNMVIASDALKYGTSSGLFFIQFVLARYSERITEMFAGGYTPNDLSLDNFKKSIGLAIKQIPVRNTVISPVLFAKYVCPALYKRIFAETNC